MKAGVATTSFYFWWRKSKNWVMQGLFILSALIVILPLIFIAWMVVKNGIQSMSWDFFTESAKPIGEAHSGMLHALVGTVMIIIMAGMIAIPWGIGCGIYLSEYSEHKLASLLRTCTDLLAGVPSIVIGIFAYLVWVVPLKKFSALAGAFALSIIMLPIIIRSTEEVLKLVPVAIREAGLALGLPRYKVILSIVVFGSRKALLTGVILALARASGETAPLLFTAFGNMLLSYSPLDPMASLPIQIYNYAISPYEEWHKLAWTGALVLMLLVLVMNLVAKFVVHYDGQWKKK